MIYPKSKIYCRSGIKQMKKITIIGTGISGLTAAYLLNRKHDIIVFEKNDYIGGHTHNIIQVNKTK